MNITPELKKWLTLELMITKDVAALLGVSNARVKALVKDGRLIPIKSEEKCTIFLRSEVVILKEELRINRSKFMKKDPKDK
ncbi:helix-turn-helix transcriptional regulator [Bacillus cereus group sp. TH40LC]|uniref:helix-turn-helix transcriptional regulator n=1 Tax=Bacillus cereus group sp. TH40LC TaxID=3018039 RepID=UPI0022E81A72|nr:helix-turn-helix domain-containing protein [Bacillus cereus group sp. TH40LC]MDA1515814.1 helix-turn-helix domain-containing protein [Bacillus cereus group sp. TH40LC]